MENKCGLIRPYYNICFCYHTLDFSRSCVKNPRSPCFIWKQQKEWFWSFLHTEVFLYLLYSFMLFLLLFPHYHPDQIWVFFYSLVDSNLIECYVLAIIEKEYLSIFFFNVFSQLHYILHNPPMAFFLIILLLG